MPRLTETEVLEEEQVEIRSAANLLPLTWSADLPDYALDLRWSPDGSHLAALPSTGSPQVFPRRTGFQPVSEGGHPACPASGNLPSHRGGNGSLAWHPDGSTLATFG